MTACTRWEVCTVVASVAVSHGNLDISFPTSPLYLADFLSCPKFTLGDFLGALDDEEEFFVVEGSGGGGVAGSQTPK